MFEGQERPWLKVVKQKVQDKHELMNQEDYTRKPRSQVNQSNPLLRSQSQNSLNSPGLMYDLTDYAPTKGLTGEEPISHMAHKGESSPGRSPTMSPTKETHLDESSSNSCPDSSCANFRRHRCYK